MFITNNLGIKNFNQPIQNRWMRHTDSPVSFGTNKLERSPNSDEASFSAQIQEPVVTYDRKNWVDKVIFPVPTSLKEVTEFLSKPKILRDFTCFSETELKEIGDSKFADTKIIESLGHGTSACAFLLEDGRVLKISNEEHFKRKHEDFDIPIYEEGPLKNKYCNNLYYYIEQYANPDEVTDDEIETVVKRIIDKGYGTWDICPCQFGKTADGNVYLLDPECAYEKE